MDGGSGSGDGRRNFLILQGVASRFFARLGSALEANGHGVKRVHFHAGDWLFGPLFATHYRGKLDAWPEFLEAKLREWRITDIVLFGDCRPLHAAAVKIAKRHGLPYFVFEEGYLRPNWITLEHGGTNGHSALPRDPDWFRAEARSLPPWQDGIKVPTTFWQLAKQDIAYNVSGVVLGLLYPFYRWHRPIHPILEYGGWLGRLGRRALFDKARLEQGLRTVATSGKRYFLFPLQLDHDTQIREHSPFKQVAPAIEYVIASFAGHAPADTLLAIKEHPLDNGLCNWRKIVRRVAERHGVGARVIYLPGGDLDTLLKGTSGVATINSTVGARTLYFNRPLKTMGNAVYDVPGLTFQGPLDRFWDEAEPPDPELHEAFRRVLVSRCLINGNFYNREGIALAVAGSVQRLEAYPGRVVEARRASLPQDVSPGLAPDLITDSLVIGS